jgi:hypothetical protein
MHALGPLADEFDLRLGPDLGSSTSLESCGLFHFGKSLSKELLSESAKFCRTFSGTGVPLYLSLQTHRPFQKEPYNSAKTSHRLRLVVALFSRTNPPNTSDGFIRSRSATKVLMILACKAPKWV